MDAKQGAGPSLEDRLHDEMIDAVDEEIELEIDDHRLSGLLADGVAKPEDSLDRHAYFKELLRLQKELIKLQDWVAYQRLKLVVLFEGRDAAGKFTAPSPGTVKAPAITASRKLQLRLRASFITAGRTSLQCTWHTRPMCLSSTASGSPPANVMCPASNSRPTASLVRDIS